jgi:hypothetical protein
LVGHWLLLERTRTGLEFMPKKLDGIAFESDGGGCIDSEVCACREMQSAKDAYRKLIFIVNLMISS